MDSEIQLLRDRIDSLEEHLVKTLGQLAGLKIVAHTLLITHHDVGNVIAILASEKNKRETKILYGDAEEAFSEGFEEVFRELV